MERPYAAFYLAALPPEFRNALKREIRRSEILFWAERPSPLGFARTQINRALKSLRLVVPGSLMVGIYLASVDQLANCGEWVITLFGSLLIASSLYFLYHAFNFDDPDILSKIKRIFLMVAALGSLMVGILLTSFRYSSGWGEWTLGFIGSLLNAASMCFILYACSVILKGSRTLYAVTDRRVLAMLRNRQGFTTLANTEVHDLSSVECMNGTGDISFWDDEEARQTISHGIKLGMLIYLKFPHIYAFSGIKNPRNVEQLIRDIFGKH